MIDMPMNESVNNCPPLSNQTMAIDTRADTTTRYVGVLNPRSLSIRRVRYEWKTFTSDRSEQ